MRVLLINGPNLNLLGKREPEVYGTKSLKQIEKDLHFKAKDEGIILECFQSNSEGEIVSRIQKCVGVTDGILINAGAYTHYSYAIRDAIESIDIPAIEIHLSDPSKREDFRKTSVLSSVCIDTVSGLGKNSYLEGLKILIK